MKYNLSWYVYHQDANSGKIEKWDIFRHGRFTDDVNKLMRQSISRSSFSEEIDCILSYYFWSKSEYEIILKNWIGKDCEIKIDVYDQVMLNFDKFIDYLWEIKTQ